ncbi:hypothetical protein CBER1_10785 [Cercospora berteroae]|uniref:Uncharacterized protein n=1 Tax=Cercospora berteroae TaxID=357750 RepID=A0A2S6CF58_9PEZI|nr:hypothetical protein CBER1_10785 [Cercospora berteroae]
MHGSDLEVAGLFWLLQRNGRRDPDAPGGSHKVIACSETTYCCARLSVDTSRDPYYCCPGNISATSEVLTLGPADYLAGIRLYTTWPPNPSATSTQSANQATSSSASLATPTGDGGAPATEEDGLSTGAIAEREWKNLLAGSENETEQMVQNEGSVLPRNKPQGAVGKAQPGEMYSGGRAAELPIEDRSYELYTEDRRAELPEDGRL